MNVDLDGRYLLLWFSDEPIDTETVVPIRRAIEDLVIRSRQTRSRSTSGLSLMAATLMRLTNSLSSFAATPRTFESSFLTSPRALRRCWP